MKVIKMMIAIMIVAVIWIVMVMMLVITWDQIVMMIFDFDFWRCWRLSYPNVLQIWLFLRKLNHDPLSTSSALEPLQPFHPSSGDLSHEVNINLLVRTLYPERRLSVHHITILHTLTILIIFKEEDSWGWKRNGLVFWQPIYTGVRMRATFAYLTWMHVK